MSLQHRRLEVMRIMAMSPVVRCCTARKPTLRAATARAVTRDEMGSIVMPCSLCNSEAVHQCAELRRAELR